MAALESTQLLTELEPVVEENLNRHLAIADEWMPHEYVPWSLGRDFADLGGEPWELAQSPVVIPIPGAKRPQSITDSAAAAALELSDDELARLDAS